MAKQIIIDVSPTGETRIHTKGFFGSACKAASKCLESLGQVTADTPTAEMYANEATVKQEHQQ